MSDNRFTDKLLKRPIPDLKYGSAPVYDSLIFMDEQQRKEWEEMPESQKSFVMNHLKECCSKMENKLAIELLCNVITDLISRIKKLEEN